MTTPTRVEPYYSDDTVQLFLGDCREVLPALDIDPDCVVADPPYEETPLEWDRWPTGWLDVAASVTSAMWCFLPLRQFAEPPYRGQEFHSADWKLSHDIEPAWDEEHDHIVWKKHNATGPDADRFRRVHEPAAFWYRGRWADVYREPQRVTTGVIEHGRIVKQGAKDTGQRGKYRTGSWSDDGTRLMTSVIYARSMHRRGAIHKTEKPPELLDPLIRYGCPPGGLVLDVFAGSGSTAVSARLSGRRSLLVEGSEAHCEAIANRLSQDVLPLDVTA